MASSIASLVPDPIAKCAVWGGAPISTTGVSGKQVLENFDGGALREPIQAVRYISFLGGLDDERRGLGVEPVDMCLEPAVLGSAKIEGESVVEFLGAQPDVAVRSNNQIWLKHIRVAVSDFRIQAVGCDDEIGLGEVEIAARVLVEREFDIEPHATPLQNVEELLAADADEAVAGRALSGPLEPDFDIVPMVECGLDFGGGFWIPDPHRRHRRVRKHYPPAERVIGLIALDDRDRVLGMQLLHQQAEIEARRPSTHANDSHANLPRSAKLL